MEENILEKIIKNSSRFTPNALSLYTSNPYKIDNTAKKKPDDKLILKPYNNFNRITYFRKYKFI